MQLRNLHVYQSFDSEYESLFIYVVHEQTGRQRHTFTLKLPTT